MHLLAGFFVKPVPAFLFNPSSARKAFFFPFLAGNESPRRPGRDGIEALSGFAPHV
jgi:hypothetical protein